MNRANSSRTDTYKQHCHHSGGLSPPTSPECHDGVFPATFTSHLSVNTVCDVVDTFDDFKKWLVHETGFGGTLGIPRQKKLNLKFNAWIMSRVDVEAREIDLGHNKKLGFWDADAHKNFGVPYGPRQVREAGKVLNAEAVSFIRNALGMASSDSTHSLKAAEAFLMKDISPKSSKMEQDCFKTAYIIFVVGHILSPGNKHDYSSIDYWYAIGSAELIPEFNWCQFILDELMKAIVKLKLDIQNKASSANLGACHLFLQVFVLDNLDLGGLNKKHDSIPRIANFNYESIKRMIIMASSPGKGETSYTSAMLRPASLVGYTRVQHHTMPDVRADDHFMQQDPQPLRNVRGLDQTPTSIPHMQGTAGNVQAHTALMGAMDFSRHLTNAHPNLPADGFALNLREYMGRQILNATNMRNTQISYMIKFADTLIENFVANCICCTARGFTNCILRDANITKGGMTLQGRRLDLDSKQSGSTTDHAKKARKCVADIDQFLERPPKFAEKTPQASYGQVNAGGEQTEQFTPTAFNHNKTSSTTNPQHIRVQHKPQTKCPLQDLTARAGDMAAAIRQIYEQQISNPGFVIFGDYITHNPEKAELKYDIPWADHWFPGHTIYFKMDNHGYSKLWSYISRLPMDNVSRPWIIHSAPRYINIPGIVIRKQLVGTHPLDHEVCSAIIRRFNQILSAEATELCNYPWSFALEPDFAIAALAGMHCPTLAHIRNQFVNEDIHINACWLFHAPVPLIDEWCNLAFDMSNKIIHIMDPTACSRGLSAPRKKKLCFAADKVLEALFNCINIFFTSWPIDGHGWKNKYPILMDSHYSKDESGLCTTFFVKNFGGTNMKLAVSKDNLNNHRLMLVHQVLEIEGNSSQIAHDHLIASMPNDTGLDG